MSAAAVSTQTTNNLLALCQEIGYNLTPELKGCKVLSCKPTATAPKKAGKKDEKKEEVKTWDVQLSQTVLFPEGGGQRGDSGVLFPQGGHETTPITVVDVLREADGSVTHRVTSDIPVDTVVDMKVDWDKRIDHMQHHTGQHLISALALKLFGFNTVSWWLATSPQFCHIELDTPNVTEAQIAELNAAVNDAIYANHRIILHVFPDLQKSRENQDFVSKMKKPMPDDHKGAVRVVEIEGVELNPCCGTHFDSLSQLQLIHISHCEKSKTTSKIFFVAGRRAFSVLRQTVDMDRKLTALLSCNSDAFVELIKKLQVETKEKGKTNMKLLKDLADVESKTLLHQINQHFAPNQTSESKQPEQPEGILVLLNREEAGLGYLSNIVDNLIPALNTSSASNPVLAHSLLFLTSPDEVEGKDGTFLLASNDDNLLKSLSADVAKLLNGKGGGRSGRYQGKGVVGDAKKRQEAIDFIASKLKVATFQL